VVSTSVGAEGLDVHHGKDVILADNPKAFAEAVLMLLKDGDVRRRYERAAADLARGYDWPVVGAKFEEVLEKVTGRAALAQGRQYTAASFAGSGTSSAPGVR